METLHDCELHDWSRYGKVRAAWEKWLRDPDDVFIQAEKRRRELRKKSPESQRDRSGIASVGGTGERTRFQI